MTKRMSKAELAKLDNEIMAAAKSVFSNRGSFEVFHVTEALGISYHYDESSVNRVRRRLMRMVEVGKLNARKAKRYDAQKQLPGNNYFGGCGSCVRRYYLFSLPEEVEDSPLTTEELKDYAKDAVDEMDLDQRQSFLYDPESWKDGITTSHVIAIRESGERFIETSEEWGRLAKIMEREIRERGKAWAESARMEAASQIKLTPEETLEVFDALAVIAKTPEIAEFLAAHDPKALEQVEKALEIATLDDGVSQ